MSNRASNGKFITPTKLPQAFTISFDKKAAASASETKSCFAGSPIVFPDAEERARQIRSACRWLNFQATIIMFAAKVLYGLLWVCLLLAVFVVLWTALRDESLGPLCSLLFRCWAKKTDDCQLRALAALFPTERLAGAPRFSIKIADTGLAGAEVLYELGIPLIADSFPIVGVAAILIFACIRLLRFFHNQAVHLATIIATICPDQTRPEPYCDLPNLL